MKARISKAKEFDFGKRVIKAIRDVDFSVMDGYDFDGDNVRIRYKPQHGTVVYIAGAVEGDEDSLICMGANDGSTEFKMAFYPDFLEFEKRLAQADRQRKRCCRNGKNEKGVCKMNFWLGFIIFEFGVMFGFFTAGLLSTGKDDEK